MKAIVKYAKIVKDKPYGHVVRRIYISKADMMSALGDFNEANLPAETRVKITIQVIKNN
jgi:hypothetical protein